MPRTSPADCRHGYAHELGLMSKVPPRWLIGVTLPDDGAEHESAWCRDCERYVWRELGSTYWTALTPPLWCSSATIWCRA